MLENIKSIYFSINVFTYIDKKRKLKLVIYNKKLRNILNIGLINYKLLSGKYIIHEGNDICKIYDPFDDKIIFEGNYIKGKGKEYYDDGKLILEGVYKNGLKNGKCTEYYNDGKILIEGEYVNPIDVLIKYIDLYDPNLNRTGIHQIDKDYDNEELRYSLRSILKNIPWVRKIFILMPNEKVRYLKDYRVMN